MNHRMSAIRASVGRTMVAVPIAVVLLAGSACGTTAETDPVAGDHPATTATSERTTSAAPRFEDEVVDGECFLTAAEMSTLAGVSVDAAENVTATGLDGSARSRCEYNRGMGTFRFPVASISVRPPDEGLPIDLVVALHTPEDSRTIPGIARAVVISEETSDLRAWICTDHLAVTVLLSTNGLPSLPTDEQWADAARRIVARLPAR
ncbi:hypothetical protein [Nocardia otitidiscaviarum]|uniref:hypothetical protein n=1 Tax=Nocardia otitidiscaviarum TaxID=1823 RepID=UPI001895EB17|nr:hypothetical protein [Nocardia otitidiscaviarum]MBF6178430.1 hypothetical protein [Nocardia otitidiscaviarum]